MTADGVGSSPQRPDGRTKVTGTFPYAGDGRPAGLLHGRTLRSPYPAAHIRRIDTGAARTIDGVAAVLTAADVPGAPTYGLIQSDQPVFASDVVRYHGEPVAAVAAVDAATAARALAAIEVDYEPFAPLADPTEALDPERAPIHPAGNVFREILLRHGDPDAEGPVVVTGSYRIGMQDQAFLGCEAAIATPTSDGGVELTVATQWLHSDREQIAACLDLPEHLVRVTLGGVGGAFGGREDVTLQIHTCLLARATGRPVRLAYSREESFLGHPHRHPALLTYRTSATRDGRLVAVRARVLMDGGAYASTSPAVLANAVTHAGGPYKIPNASLDGWAVRTNNPPCGAMRGFGVPQAVIGHEAQLDLLAAKLGLDPLEIRRRNALAPGDTLAYGAPVPGSLPVREVIDTLAAIPLPAAADVLPGGSGGCAEPARVRRGVGYALAAKNLLYSEGFDDYSTARVRVELGPDGVPHATVHCACAEVGQGFVTLAGQIVRTELGVERVQLRQADTVAVGSAGSTSASRQSWMSGGAVRAAAVAVRELVQGRLGEGGPLDAAGLAAALGAGPVEAERVFRPRRTEPLGRDGQGDAHVAFAVSAHRAVVEVDLDLGLVRVAQMALALDVGRVLNPLALRGQAEGGTAQGIGLALLEEVVVDGGTVRTTSFADYLLPTACDVPPLVFEPVEVPHPDSPYGAKGAGEAPTCTATAAVLAAVRAATGRPVTRVPARPEDLVDLDPPGAPPPQDGLDRDRDRGRDPDRGGA